MRFPLLAASFALASFAFAPAAHAEPSSWLAVGGGYAFQHDGLQNANSSIGAMTLSLGVGTTAEKPFVIGGILRSVTYFTHGTDLGLAVRFATGGFARGDWGLALDTGVVARWWDKQEAYGHFPLQIVLTGGLPWGFNVAVGTQLWDVTGDSPTARGGFAVLELDLLRLTVNRTGATNRFWPNPSPAGSGSPTPAQ